MKGYKLEKETILKKYKSAAAKWHKKKLKSLAFNFGFYEAKPPLYSAPNYK